jgi:hypothetical protein
MVKNREELNEFLEVLSLAPESQIDNKSLTKIFKNLISKDDAELRLGLMFCIDHISYCSSAAGIYKMYLYEILKGYFGITFDQAQNEDWPWRDGSDFSKLSEYEERFKN